MQRKQLLNSLKEYKESRFFSPGEEAQYTQLITFINANPGCFSRENPGHITGSVWLVNYDLTQVLLTHHKKLGQWFQLGGHADDDPHISSVAMKEAQEESGIESLRFLDEGIYDIDIHAIPNKCIAHYDIRYLIQAPKNAQFTVSDESHTLAWVSFENIPRYNGDLSIMRMVKKMLRL